MIDGVGKNGPGPIDLGRAERNAGPARVANAGIRSGESPVESAVFGLVSGGAPVDGAKVAAIRAAIAAGRYPVDPERIAEHMIALDLPQRA
jgi:negative regulator of flagellin synthesis FlgM